MNHGDTAELLTLVAAFDQRTLGDADVLAWQAVAADQGWTLPLARRAVVAHYGVEGKRIMPSDITARIQAARKAVAAALPQDELVPPRELADDVQKELAWLRNRRDELTNIGLAQWAEGRRVAPRLALDRAE